MMIKEMKTVATNKNNVDDVSNNLFILSGDEEERTPYEWDGMPAFEQPKGEAEIKMIVRFRTYEDVREFAEKIGQNNITDRTKSIWYPALDKGRNSLLRWMDEDDA